MKCQVLLLSSKLLIISRRRFLSYGLHWRSRYYSYFSWGRSDCVILHCNFRLNYSMRRWSCIPYTEIIRRLGENKYYPTLVLQQLYLVQSGAIGSFYIFISSYKLMISPLAIFEAGDELSLLLVLLIVIYCNSSNSFSGLSLTFENCRKSLSRHII